MTGRRLLLTTGVLYGLYCLHDLSDRVTFPTVDDINPT